MRIRQLHQDFGAEILDLDLLGTVKPSEIEALRDAYDEYQLLLFRPGQTISPERQVDICSWFGPIANNIDGKQWMVLHNERPAGSAQLGFHSDFSYADTPLSGLSLHALEIPSTGTSTAFVSSAHAWSTLSAERQQQLSSMTVRHGHRYQLIEGYPEFVADHPVRFIHPRTGRPVLLVTEHHTKRFLELEPKESDELLDELSAHIYAPEHIYVHRWQPLDLVIWDNIAVQHARPEQSEPENGTRAMQRVAINKIGQDEIVNRFRDQAALG